MRPNLQTSIGVAAAGVQLLIGVAPWPSGLTSRAPEAWSMFPFLRLSLVIGGFATLACALLLGRRVRLPALAWGMSLALATSAGATIAIMIKYLLGSVPGTWTEDVIVRYAAEAGSLTDLYRADNLTEPPLKTPIYPPGYFLALRAAAVALRDMQLAARAVTVLSIIGICVGLHRASRGSLPGGWALVPPALFLTLFPTLTWSGAPTKPEYAATALAVAAFALTTTSRPGAIGRSVIVGMTFGLAALVKYTIVGFALAVATDLVLQRRWRDVAVLAGGVLLVPLMAYALLWGPTDGAVWLITVTGNAARPDPVKAFRMVFDETIPLAVVALTAAAALPALRVPGPSRAAALAAVIALALFALASGRPGSSRNYALEFVAAASLVLAPLVVLRPQPDTERSRVAIATAALLFVILGDVPRKYALAAQSPHAAERQHLAATAALESLNLPTGSFVLNDPEYTRAIRGAALVPVVYDAFQFTLMTDNGVVSDEPIRRLLAGGSIPLVLLSAPPSQQRGAYGRRHYTEPVLELIERNYSCLARTDSAEPVICVQRRPEPAPADVQR